MKIKELSVSKSAKFGKFNKYQAHVGLTVETDNTDELENLWSFINKELAKQIVLEVDEDWMLTSEDKETIKKLKKTF